MKAMKFRVHSPEHSKVIQEQLFKLGCMWRHSATFSKTEYNFLFARANGSLMASNVTSLFESYDYQETTLDDLYKMMAL